MVQFPFTAVQFLDVFFRYNLTVWPAQLILCLLAIAAAVCAIRKTASSDRILFCILGFFWLWMGLVYHILFFSSINTVAYLFGILFIVQALVLWYFGMVRKVTGFHASWDAFSIAGVAFIFYSLILYPVIGTAAGHPFPCLPTFGLPCPTTIFTFGIFLLADRKVPLFLVAIPLLWSCIGFFAALSLGIVEDYGLLIAGIAGTILIIIKNQKSNAAS
ncbi:DUF6064 family protein [uncultured Methanoregula sp.]|uniref:DUF6064 family protein n=1 Tax=uncultured Methanoregula sp. TaxID=1005933 RepID=UPI002AAC1E0A|nr:DUF6064 family protein [uncultured Methanoregula sp.]